MKYGLLAITPLKNTSDRFYINLGDWIQYICIRDLYHQMGIDDDDIISIDINDIMNYEGEYVILPININLSLNWIIDIFPLPNRIIPVFLGLSFFSGTDLPQSLIEYFRMYGPIGCRDESTLRLMRENYIPAYFSGCITSLLPRRESTVHNDKPNKIFFVDVPQSFKQEYTEFVRLNKNIIVESSHVIEDKRTQDKEYCLVLAEETMKKYRDEARLVVTSRLHCMAPCVAMGIPIIAVADNISERMSAVDKYIHIYSPEDYADVDLNGMVVDYEKYKEKMLGLAKKRLREVYEKYSDLLDISFFYEDREKSDYNSLYKKRISEINVKDYLEYIIWGAGQVGIHVYDTLQKIAPMCKCVAVVDSYCEGVFRGHDIIKPACIADYPSAYVFVATYSGEKAAVKLLSDMNKKEIDDYMCLGTSVG